MHLIAVSTRQRVLLSARLLVRNMTACLPLLCAVAGHLHCAVPHTEEPACDLLLQVGNVVQQHAGAVEALVSELLPIAAEYLAAPGSAAVPTAVQQPQGWLQRQDQQQQDPDQQLRQSQQVQHEPSSPASSRRSSSTGRSSQLCGLDQASVTQQLVEYSLAIAAAVPSADMARREFTWRNGWFLGRRVTPQHEHWLLRAGCQDLLLQHARC